MHDPGQAEHVRVEVLGDQEAVLGVERGVAVRVGEGLEQERGVVVELGEADAELG